jgi:Holliday junction resolvasome RuvABC endonuclease subunit
LEARLNAIHDAVRRLIEACEPGLLVVEDLYTEYRFPRPPSSWVMPAA